MRVTTSLIILELIWIIFPLPKWRFSFSSNGRLGQPNPYDSWTHVIVDKYWTHSPIFVKYISFTSPFFDPHLILQHSNIRINLRWATYLHPLTSCRSSAVTFSVWIPTFETLHSIFWESGILSKLYCPFRHLKVMLYVCNQFRLICTRLYFSRVVSIKWEYVELGKSIHLGRVDLNEHGHLAVVKWVWIIISLMRPFQSTIYWNTTMRLNHSHNRFFQFIHLGWVDLNEDPNPLKWVFQWIGIT